MRIQDRVQDLILAIVQEMGRPVHSTTLVKIAYLAENAFFEHTGRTITGLEYTWDKFGPNAIGNAIIREATNLAAEGRLLVSESESMYGGPSRTYKLGPKGERSRSKLDYTEVEFIKKVAKESRPLTIRQLVKKSKETKPFEQATQYQHLTMKQDPRIKERIADLLKDKDYISSLDKAKEAILAGKVVTLEEIEAKRRAKGL